MPLNIFLKIVLRFVLVDMVKYENAFSISRKEEEILHHNFMAFRDIMLCMCSKWRVQWLINMEKPLTS